MRNRKLAALAITVPLVTGCGGRGDQASTELQTPQGTQESSIDQRSYRLGSIGAFAEMVRAGVKQLALSAPLQPAEMDALIHEAEKIAKDHDVEIYREADFLVTDLFSADLTEGTHVLLIFRGDTLQEYMELKAEKLRLERLGRYEGEARAGIARRFGALLSYSDEKIEALLQSKESGL
jgi:hypothetical protein